jgi:serine/threonine-protein kinase
MSPQSQIAHYRITSKLGEGGMGAVYRATDTKLNRDVAVKVLPDAFAADPDRLARFTREAQVLASMNHPNIAAIHGVEERALILELVEGPTLAERIAQGPIPVEEAIDIARQIAEALEYAHERGIVHRDLKPANVKVTPEGQVKVLDFGLAKALTPDLAPGDPMSSPTMTMRATMAGMIMGTAGYMAPEQAKGKPADRRADIWAFGVVLVEMLTGRLMYTGETVSETLASVIKDAPDLSGLPAETPERVRRMLKRCLDKDPKKRLQAIGEARIAIDTPDEPAAAPAPSAVAAVPAKRGAPWWIVAAAAILPAAALAGLLWQAMRPVPRPLERFSADLGPDAIAGSHNTVAISPDGTRIAFPVRTAAGGRAIASRLMASSTATVLSGTGNGSDPFFSPDGQWIAFFADSALRKVSVQGGAAVKLCDTSVARGGAWSEDGFIYGTFDGLHLARVPAAGGNGKPESVTDPEKHGARTDRWPQILPGGESVLLTIGGAGSTGSYEDSTIGVLSLKTGQIKIVQRGGYYGRYLPSGHLVFVHQGTMFGVPFDLKRMETRGMPAPVFEDLVGNPGQGGGQYAVSANGTLVYLAGTTRNGGLPLVWMDRSGNQRPLMDAPAARAAMPRLSPDGKLLAYVMNGDVYVYDPARNATSRITFDPGANAQWPVWTPDGKHIVYSPAHEIWWVRSDGSGKPEVIYESKNNAVATSFTPDGKVLVFHQPGKNRDLYTVGLDLTDPDHPKAGTPELFLATPAADVEGSFSPDGRWLAYASNESGSYHVFVRPFPEGAQGAGQAQISSGHFPIWSRTAREIFYLTNEGQIMVVPYVVNGRAFLPGKASPWSEKTIAMQGLLIPFDLAPDGKRFVVSPASAETGGEKANLHVTFLLNFFDEMKRRMP